MEHDAFRVPYLSDRPSARRQWPPALGLADPGPARVRRRPPAKRAGATTDRRCGRQAGSGRAVSVYSNTNVVGTLARVDEVITALRELCRGRTAGKIRTHLNYFLKNRHRFAYTTMVGLGLPRGSGAVESAIRRVINLRIKGASIYWLPESVDAILLLRSFYKSGRWNCLQRMAMTPVGVSA